MTASPTSYTVYTKPDCPNCEKTKDYFDSKGVTYTAVDITDVPAALEYITAELGYSQAPVVVNNADDQDHWSGLRRDKLANFSYRRRIKERMVDHQNKFSPVGLLDQMPDLLRRLCQRLLQKNMLARS